MVSGGEWWWVVAEGSSSSTAGPRRRGSNTDLKLQPFAVADRGNNETTRIGLWGSVLH